MPHKPFTVNTFRPDPRDAKIRSFYEANIHDALEALNHQEVDPRFIPSNHVVKLGSKEASANKSRFNSEMFRMYISISKYVTPLMTEYTCCFHIGKFAIYSKHIDIIIAIQMLWKKPQTLDALNYYTLSHDPSHYYRSQEKHLAHRVIIYLHSKSK